MEWSRVTHDESRLRLWESLRGGVGCVLQRGPSFAWLSEAVRASKRARRRLSQLSVRFGTLARAVGKVFLGWFSVSIGL